jgi:hypothetical protein
MGGVTIPLVEVSGPDARVNARQVAVEREDYVGNSGGPIVTSVRTERADGSNDCTVFAPVAMAGVS